MYIYKEYINSNDISIFNGNDIIDLKIFPSITFPEIFLYLGNVCISVKKSNNLM